MRNWFIMTNFFFAPSCHTDFAVYPVLNFIDTVHGPGVVINGRKNSLNVDEILMVYPKAHIVMLNRFFQVFSY